MCNLAPKCRTDRLMAKADREQFGVGLIQHADMIEQGRDPRILIKVCWAILAGRCVDLYLMMLPTFAADEPFSPVWAIAAAAAVAGLFMLRFDSEFGKAAAVPTDPRVAEALSYHN